LNPSSNVREITKDDSIYHRGQNGFAQQFANQHWHLWMQFKAMPG